MPCRDLGAPAGDRAPEALDLGRAGVVLEIDAELGHELDGEVGVADLVDRADDFFGVPGQADLAVGVVGVEQAAQFRVSGGVEAFVGDRHQLADPVERVGLAAPVAERVVLHAATGLVEHEVGELHHMERICDLDGVREHRVEHRPIRPGQIEGCPLDRLTPCGGPLAEPGARRCGVTTRDDVEELSAGDVNDLGRPHAMAESAEPAEQDLVESDRCRRADTVRINARPWRTTASITVCQSQPRSFATSATARPWWPT